MYAVKFLKEIKIRYIPYLRALKDPYPAFSSLICAMNQNSFAVKL